MKKVNYFLALFLIFCFTLSCSLINNLKEKLSKKENDKKEENVSETKEKKKETISEEDMKCYNAYIDASNKVSETMEELHKSYLQTVPDPKTLRKNSFILVVGPEIQWSSLERIIKDYNRSLYENGELAKLKPDNPNMKKDIEKEFVDLLKVLDEYKNTSRIVIDYYKDKKFEEDLSPAAGYDADMKEKYEKYKSQFANFTDVLKNYRPRKKQKNPDEISNPDEKAMAILSNAYENTLDNAEEFLERFEKINKDSETGNISEILNKLESDFQKDNNKIMSAEFSDMTKAFKYSFEDYFSKTVTDFLKETKKFLDDKQKGKMNDVKFNDGYNEVIRYYNYMINAYNSNTKSMDMFRSF